MYSRTHLAVHTHTVVSPYSRSRGISSRVACRNGGAVTNLWGVGTATAISDSESPIYIKNISEYASFSASDPELTCISFCICVRPCLKVLHNAGKTVSQRISQVAPWFGSIVYFAMIMSPFGRL